MLRARRTSKLAVEDMMRRSGRQVVRRANEDGVQRADKAATGLLSVAPGGSVRGEEANLAGLVLSCIEAKFRKKICVGKLSPRSTQCTPLHGSAISFFVKHLQ